MKKITWIIGILLLLIVIYNVPEIQALDTGCCCNAAGQAEQGVPATQCGSGFEIFITSIDPELYVLDPDNVCYAVCEAEPPVVITPPSSGACGSPTYSPTPQSLEAAPLRGQKGIMLSWILPCPAETTAVVIGRCEGTSCTDFEEVATIPKDTSFNDSDNALLWGEDYRYSVILKYSTSPDSVSAKKTASPGEIECENHYSDDEIFCINSYYYERYREYLQTNGYKTSTPGDFEDPNFDVGVEGEFSINFRKSFSCNDLNQKTIQLQCTEDQICVVKQNNGVFTSQCLVPDECKVPATHFGLNYTQQNCELSGGQQRYCFYDKSHSLANECYQCKPTLDCIDYKSEGACERDNCGLGTCNWVDIFPEIGVGVCVDEVRNNCPFCNQPEIGRAHV